MPVYFIWIKYLSWIGYGNEILTINQWDGVTGIACPPNSTICQQSGAEVLQFYKMNKVQSVFCFCLNIV